MERIWKPILLSAAGTLLIAACGGGGADSGPSATVKAAGEEVFKTTCSPCHGDTGVGDGLAAANLDPKPRNYTDKTWQDSVTDQEIKDVISKGGEANGLSNTMAAYGHLTEDQLNGLVWKIRSFAE